MNRWWFLSPWQFMSDFVDTVCIAVDDWIFPVKSTDPQAEELAEREAEEEVAAPLSNQVPEVCQAHRDSLCAVCDEENDDLWIHPRDLYDEESYAEPTISTANFNELVGEICARFPDNVAQIHAWADELAEREAEEEVGTGQDCTLGCPDEPPLTPSEIRVLRRVLHEGGPAVMDTIARLLQDLESPAPGHSSPGAVEDPSPEPPPGGRRGDLDPWLGGVLNAIAAACKNPAVGEHTGDRLAEEILNILAAAFTVIPEGADLPFLTGTGYC